MTGKDSPVEKTTLVEDLRALAQCPRELWLIYLATVFEYVGLETFLSTLTFWLSGDFGMSDQNAGWWASTFSLVISLFVFIVGPIIDSVGVRRMLLFSFGLAAVTRLAMSLSPNATSAIVSLLAFGFAYATSTPVLQTAIQRIASPRTRAFAFSFWYVSLNLGSAFGGPLIDLTRKAFLDPSTQKLTQRVISLPILGPRAMTANAVIMGFGFLAALLSILVVLFVRRDFEHRRAENGDAAPESKKVNPLEALRDVLADRVFWRFMFLLVLISLVRMMFQHMHFTWPKYVTRVEGESFPVGMVSSVNAMLIMVLAPIGTIITRTRRPFEVLVVGAFISSLSPFVLCFGSTLPFQIAMIVTLTIGEALWSPRLYEYNVAIAPRGREATYVSLAVLPYFLAKFLVGPTSGYLLAHYVPEGGPHQPAIMWALIGISTMVGPTGIWIARGWIGKEEKDAPATDAAATG
ncbi:putative permease [Minicystis rosea]|nr:putative permease [Minicystis rosea]